MKVELLVSRYPRMIGLARYSAGLQKYFSRMELNFGLVQPDYPWPVQPGHTLLRLFGYDLKAFLNIFPISAGFTDGAVKHFTTQMMATLFSFKQNLSPVVVTVHDIVPYIMRNDPEQNTYRHFIERLFDHLAMQNLKHADLIITESQFTKEMIVDRLGCSSDKIRVIYSGLDQDIFRQRKVGEKFLQKYGLVSRSRYVLYVGSENPRKNLPRLIQAFARVKADLPNSILLKVGTPNHLQQYHQLQKQIRELGLENSVIFLNDLSNEDLVAFYNLADVFVFPSLIEGFGFPPLEAMACGAPVVCSDAASLPEVVGDAALLVDPHEVDCIAEAILQVLTHEDLAEDLTARGLSRVREFTWERTARETLEAYRQVL